MKSKAAKILDAVLISVLTAVSSFVILIFMADCRSGFLENSEFSRQVSSVSLPLFVFCRLSWYLFFADFLS